MTKLGPRGIVAHFWHLAIALGGLSVAGCTHTIGGPNNGVTTVRMPGTLPSVTTPRPVAPAAPPRSGFFQGVGQLDGSAGSGCRRQVPIQNFVVTGNQVRFQGFRGTIGPDNYLEMQSGSSFLFGYFDGGRFTGNYWRSHSSCNYDLVLDNRG
jgi:hypothetical protein